MNIDVPLNCGFSPEEVSRIRKRIMAAPLPGPEAEREFYLFFESLRRSAELYSLIMFQGVRIVDFDLERDRITIKDKEGRITEVAL